MSFYKEKVESLLQENMTERGFNLWKGINNILPDIWDLTTSTTGKYHKKLNGDIPTQAEHVYQMLYAAAKLLRMLNIESNTTDADKILIAVALHDGLKYGMMGTRKHTDRTHDKNIADVISQNKGTFLKIFTEEQFYEIEEMIRFHSGQWSTDVPKNETFDFKNYRPTTLIIHMLDMMSTADLIQTDVRD